MSNTSSFTSGISGRYATALFELARAENQIDTVASDMDALEAALKESEGLRDAISSPVYSREDQADAMAALSDKMGLSTLVKNTIGLMASKRRLFVLPAMVEAVKGLIADHRGEVTARVTAAQPLSDDQAARLAEALRQAEGKDVKIETTVDESLIGGMVVRLGSRMIDTSIRAKLDRMQNAMKEVG